MLLGFCFTNKKKVAKIGKNGRCEKTLAKETKTIWKKNKEKDFSNEKIFKWKQNIFMLATYLRNCFFSNKQINTFFNFIFAFEIKDIVADFMIVDIE